MDKLRRSLLLSAGAAISGIALPRRLRAQTASPTWRYDITRFEFGHTNGWLPGFADFTLATAPTNRLALVRRLPPEINGDRFGYYLRGRNTSDDLFMFLKKPITAVEAGASYEISYYIEIVSFAPSGCVGIGGAPGESVWLKAGASSTEPVAVMGETGIDLNVDKGNQSGGGMNAVVVSDIANGLPCETAEGRGVLLRRTATLPNPVTAGPSGTLWLFVGTDSGFEGTTEIYYAFIAALLTRRS